MTLFSNNTSCSSSSNNTSTRVPPGFRFHPTDEELVGYYLRKKIDSKKIDLDVIHEIDLYKLEPWDLQERCKIGSAEQTEWYFFSHKDKKYPTGTRTNRATAAGFWKATGRDKAIHAKYKLIGMRKTLVFYKGRAPNGQKSDWIMHEYRLEDDHPNSNSSNNNDDGWVVCRVFKKRSSHKPMDRDISCCYDDQIALLPELESPSKFDLPYHQHQHQHHHQLVNCKQEFGVEQPPFFDPFAQLPRLESPRITPLSSHPALLKGFLPHHTMRDFSLEPSASAAGAASSSFEGSAAGEHHRPPFQQPVTDWRMVDRLAAAQLSHEVQASSSKEGFQNVTSGDLPSAEDVELLCRLSKQQQANSSEGDLWSFGR